MERPLRCHEADVSILSAPKRISMLAMRRVVSPYGAEN